MTTRNVLTYGNTKTAKGEASGYLTGILHLAPGDLSGAQVCPKASAGCLAACLNTAGRGRPNTPIGDSIQKARIAKTRWLFDDRSSFMQALVWSIGATVRKAKREGMTPCIRLNGTSDLPFEKFKCVRDGIEYRNPMEAFPDVQFYDYTKIPARALKWARGDMPSNYHVTFSASESNDDASRMVAMAGGNVAVVFDAIPAAYYGRKVIDGVSTDLRFLDPVGVIVGLEAKGEAKHDDSGFVKRVAVA